MSVKYMLRRVRASFVNVFEPRGFNNQEPKYSIMLLIHKDRADVPELQKKIIEAAREKWPAKFKDDTKFTPGFKNPLRDGDAERDTVEYPEYENCLFFNASANASHKPLVLDRNKTLLAKEDRRPYSGCYVNVSVSFYAFDTAGNKGVAAGLNAVQFVADGEALGGSSNYADDFDVESEDDTDDIAG